MQIDEYKDWTVPEIGKQDGQTPMYGTLKANRCVWSCYSVPIMVGRGDQLANQLMANIPSCGFPWPDDSSLSPERLSDVANVLKDRG